MRRASPLSTLTGFRALRARDSGFGPGAARGFPSTDKEGTVSIDSSLHNHYGSPGDHLRELLPLLEARGAVLLAADYSGGGDEGGVQQITLYATVERDGDGEPQLDHPRADQVILPYTGDWNDPLWERCDRILSTPYGSWCGDYSAWGVLYIDVAKRRCWMDGNETVEQPVDINDAIDITV